MFGDLHIFPSKSTLHCCGNKTITECDTTAACSLADTPLTRNITIMTNNTF